LRNNKVLTLFCLLAFFCSTSAGPHVVIENYGNWKNLSFASKSAYMTGLWDGFLIYSKEDIRTKYKTVCSENKVATVSNLVEFIDMQYLQKRNRSYSPATMLKDTLLENICRN